MGATLEFTFLYFNAYDNFVRKATMKCLERARYADYKQKEKTKLDMIRAQKIDKLRQLTELKEKWDQGKIN
jgi:hypothetical protein